MSAVIHKTGSYTNIILCLFHLELYPEASPINYSLKTLYIIALEYSIT